MRREVIALAEAVRNLSVEISPSADNPDAIRIICPRAEFPARLAAARRALDEFEAASAASNSGQGKNDIDAAVLQVALDSVFRWMRTKGIDITEPHAAVAAALRTGSGGKPVTIPKPSPSYAHDRVKTKKPKPLLKFTPEPGERVTLQNLRKKNLQADTTLTSLGHAAAR